MKVLIRNLVIEVCCGIREEAIEGGTEGVPAAVVPTVLSTTVIQTHSFAACMGMKPGLSL